LLETSRTKQLLIHFVITFPEPSSDTSVSDYKSTCVIHKFQRRLNSTSDALIPCQTALMHHIVIVGAGIIGISTAYFLSHSPSAQDHTITIFDPSPPVSGASGKAAGFISWCWTGSATASLEELSFKLYEELAQEYAGAEKWSYRQCRALAISGRMPEGEQHNLWVERFKRFKQTEYSGELGWITSEMATTGILLGGAGSFAQW